MSDLSNIEKYQNVFVESFDIEKSLLAITSADQLNRGLYAEWEEALFSLGEKYLGKGNMPEVVIRAKVFKNMQRKLRLI